jgi:hypothetical protein
MIRQCLLLLQVGHGESNMVLIRCQKIETAKKCALPKVIEHIWTRLSFIDRYVVMCCPDPKIKFLPFLGGKNNSVKKKKWAQKWFTSLSYKKLLEVKIWTIFCLFFFFFFRTLLGF